MIIWLSKCCENKIIDRAISISINLLSSIEIAVWEEINNRLCRKFEFSDFREAFAFMTRVAFVAEEHQHHPNWSNVYNTVTIELTTHDAGNIVTDKDYQLAKAIDHIILL